MEENIGSSCKMLTDNTTEVFIVIGHTVLEAQKKFSKAWKKTVGWSHTVVNGLT